MKCPTCLNKRMSPARVEISRNGGDPELMEAMFCVKCGTAVPIDKPKKKETNK